MTAVSPPPADDQAARGDWADYAGTWNEQYVRSVAKHSPAIAAMVREFDRRGTELVELRGKLDTVLIGHSYDTAMQEGAVDDLQVRAIELSGLLRGMARRQVRTYRECLSWLKQAIRADGEAIETRDRLAAVRALADDLDREAAGTDQWRRLDRDDEALAMAGPMKARQLREDAARIRAVLDGDQ